MFRLSEGKSPQPFLYSVVDNDQQPSCSGTSPLGCNHVGPLSTGDLERFASQLGQSTSESVQAAAVSNDSLSWLSAEDAIFNSLQTGA